MLQRRAFVTCFALGLVTASGCLGGTATTNPPEPSIAVEASILSASLAQDCPSADAPQGACARPEDAGADFGCRGFCQQSNMQLSFVAAAGIGTVDIVVVSVRLLDASTGASLDTLTAREPQSWNGSGYVAWDSVIESSESLRASYKLSAPNWSALNSSRSAFAAYSRRYVLEVTLRIGGILRVIRSSEITREPEVVT